MERTTKPQRLVYTGRIRKDGGEDLRYSKHYRLENYPEVDSLICCTCGHSWKQPVVDIAMSYWWGLTRLAPVYLPDCMVPISQISNAKAVASRERLEQFWQLREQALSQKSSGRWTSAEREWMRRRSALASTGSYKPPLAPEHSSQHKGDLEVLELEQQLLELTILRTPRYLWSRQERLFMQRRAGAVRVAHGGARLPTDEEWTTQFSALREEYLRKKGRARWTEEERDWMSKHALRPR